MENFENLVFLDSIQAEENFLKGKTSTPTASRRLSAAGRASLLKDRNLIPPLHSPSDRRISLPRASKNPPTMPTVADRRKSTARHGEQQEEPGRDEPTPSEKFIAEQLAALTAMIGGVKEDIGKAESRTASKIDSKVDDLACKLGARMSKAEADLSRLGAELATARQQLEAVRIAADERDKALPDMVSAIVAKKIASQDTRPDVRPGRRPRLLELAAPRPTNEESYWRARRTLRIWPVEGEDLKQGVISFLELKLRCPPGRTDVEDFEAKRLYSPPDLTAQNQVLVTFATAGLRDEVKAMARNLSGQDRKTGVQIEPPDHLRGQYQVFQRLAFQLKRKNPSLRRNIKFYDPENCLTMDVRISPEAEWKCVSYEHAKVIMKKTRARTESLSIDELEAMAEVAPRDLKKRRRETLDESDSDDDMNSTVIDLTDVNENKESNSSRCLRFINANARSLEPKIRSLYDCFSEKKLDFATLTETWHQSNRALADTLREYSSRFALDAIVRNRRAAAANGRTYGGVAFVYRKSVASFKEFQLVNHENYEVLATVGKVHGIKGKVFCLSIYAPPNLTAAKARGLIEYVSDVVGEAKRKFEDCSLVISGDFNQWNIGEITQDHPELVEVEFGPTRGDKSIDRSFVNFGRAIVESGVLPPLETETGQASDHKIAWAEAKFLTTKQKQISYTYRAYTEEGAESFLQELNTQSWTEVYEAQDSDSKANKFQEIVGMLMDRNFAWKTTTRKEGEPPWINETLRRLWKKRRKIYDREGRSRRWKKLKKKSAQLYRERAKNYLKIQREKLTGPEASKNFFKHVKAYSSKEKPKAFEVTDLFPDLNEAQTAEALAEHFSSIGGPQAPLKPEDVPTSYDKPRPVLDPYTVMQKLKTMKKPKSTVRGDIFPALVNRAAGALAFPLANIYNDISQGGNWPKIWKVESVTPIPKKSIPESVNDIRNISCTQLFSKTYESFVLNWLSSEIELRTNQYGGVKGSGAEHFLVQLWQQVLENLEDPRAASLLTSIDYSKAFNRLNYAACLKSLKTKGASTQTLRIIASFLTDRTMTVKVGGVFSNPKNVDRGAPQGSLLGVTLFNSYIDDFEAHSTDIVDYNPSENYELMPQAPNPPQDKPVPMEPAGRDYRHLPPWVQQLIQVLKYVDDNILNEKINFDNVPTDQSACRTKRAFRTENLVHSIVHQATSLEMVINSLKTHSLCISDLKSYLPRAYFIEPSGNTISSQDSMKILGFTFSSTPDMAAQVEEIRKGFIARIWTLRHLGHRGMSQADLLKVYRSILLPVHDYCSCVYNSSLTQTQANALERLQAQALKAIYGYEHSYRSLLQLTGLQTLKARRDARSDKFSAKCLANPRYQSWFQLNPHQRDTRHALKYKELHARTKRLYNSPLFEMRRRLNAQ